MERGLQEVRPDHGDHADLPRGDPRKDLITHAAKSATVVPLDWIAEPLEMGIRCPAEPAAEVARVGKLGRSLVKIPAT